MLKKHLSFLLVLSVASSSFAKIVERTDPVNFAKLSVGPRIVVPEGIGASVGIDAPVTEFLAIGGEASFTGNLPKTSEEFKPVLRLNVSVKPRLVYNDRFETYVRAQVGPAFQFDRTNGLALGVDVAFMPGFQFSMTESVGMFSEVGFGITAFPRTSETTYAGIFRSGVFFSI